MKFLKISAYSLAALLALVLLLVVFLITPPGESVIKGLVESQAGDQLGVDITIRDLSTDLVGYVRLDSIVITRPGTADTTLFAGSVFARYSLWSFLGGPFAIDSVDVFDVRTSVHRTADGEMILPVNMAGETDPDAAVEDGGAAAEKPPFVLRIATGREINLNYQDDALALAADIRQVNFELAMPDGRTASFDIQADPITVMLESVRLPAMRMVSNGSVGPDAADIERLVVTTDSLTTHLSGHLPFDSTAALQASLQVEGNPNPLLSPLASVYGFQLFRTSDDLNLTADLQGTSVTPQVDLRLTLSEVEAYETTVHDALVVASLHGDTLTADTIRAGVLGGRIRADAIVRLDTIWTSTAHADFQKINLATLFSSLTGQPSPYQGALSGRLDVVALDSNLVQSNTTASVQATGLTYGDKALPDLTAELKLQSERLTVAIDQDDLKVRADAAIGADLEGTFEATIPSLAPFGALVDIPQLAGGLKANGSLGGTRENPSVRAELSGTKLAYANVPIDTIYASFAYADSTVTIDTAFVSSAVDSIDPLRPPFDIDSLTGYYGFEVAGSGTLEELNGRANVTLRRVDFQGYALDSAQLFVIVDGRTAFVDSTRLFLDSLAVRLNGRVHLDSLAGEFTADISDHSLVDSTATDTTRAARDAGSIEGTFAYSDTAASSIQLQGSDLALTTLLRLTGSETDVLGTLDFDLDAEGTPERPRGSLRARIGGIEYDGITLDSLILRAALQDTIVTLDTLRTYGPGQLLDMRGQLALNRDSTGLLAFSDLNAVQGSAKSDSINLALLVPMLPEGMTLAGRASVDMTWDGTISDPQVRGTFDLRDVNFVPQPELDSITDFTMALTTENTMIAVDTAFGRYNNMPFTIKGTASLVNWEKLDADLRLVSEGFGQLRANGTVGAESMDMEIMIDTLMLGIFEPFVPMIDTLDGTLTCHLTLRGSPGDPEIHGGLVSKNLTVKPTLLDSTIHNGIVQISFNGNRVMIDSIYATLGKGWILLEGTLELEDQTVSDIDLGLTASSVSFSSEDFFVVTVDSTRLTYRTTTDGYRLAGRLDLGESRLTQDFPIEAILPWAKSVEQVPPDYPEMLKQTALDIQVRESRKLWVDNNLARIRMHASLAIVGTVARPTLSGQVTIEEGYLSYLDRKFDVTKGMFLMSNPNRFNPEMTLTAETKVTEWVRMASVTYNIKMSLTGTLDEPQYSLTSDPPLDEPDIVSLLTLGATRDQLTGNGGGGDVLQDRATALTSNRITGYASRQVESALGLEEFSVQGNLFNPDQGGGTRLSATKRLSDRVRVTYMSTVGSANEQAIKVEYRWTDHISLLGQTNREGKAVLNIKYGLRFK